MTDHQKIEVKNSLKEACYTIFEQRISTVKSAIHEAQQAANAEEKSSAGDKYETSRAMGHLEKDMHARQLSEHLKELASLHAVNVNILYTTPSTGALVQCRRISFFIASGLGKQSVDGNNIIFVSPHAPLAKSLFLKTKGENFIFNGLEDTIVDIY